MKNIKRTELILGVIAVIALIIRKLELPGSVLLLTLAMLGLAIFYYLFTFAVMNNVGIKNIFKRQFYIENKIKTRDIIVGLSAGWAYSVIYIGILFTNNHWPGNRLMLYVGLIYAVGAAIADYIFKKDKPKLQLENLVRAMVAIFLGIVYLILY